jgi:Xaa-Pro aminopeptidase
MHACRLDAVLISKAENIRYLSGFTAGNDAVLLISDEDQFLFTDSRYTQQVQRESPGWELKLEKPPLRRELFNVSQRYAYIGFESQVMSYNDYSQLSHKLSARLIPLPGLVENLRLTKEEEELERLRQAAHTGDLVFDKICGLIQPGISERHIANQIGYCLREYGCDKESFDTISVSGPNAALPHGQPGGRLLQPGDMLTMDYGGFYQGYASDMTRTIAVARAEPLFRDRYEAVLEAQMAGVSMVQAGVSCRAVDQAVRACLSRHGLEEFFIHGTGHGLGLEIHEPPRVSSQSSEILKENMVITIEPGIYISGWGGIRIEDTVIVKQGGCEIITHSDKNLLIIDGGIK